MIVWLQNVAAWLARDALKERASEPEIMPDLIDRDHAVFDEDGWAIGERIERIPSRPGWYYRSLRTASGWPDGITHHYTAVDGSYKTNRSMAIRRRDRTRKSMARVNKNGKTIYPGSWHFSVAKTGEVIQQISIKKGAFHAGSGSARRLDYGWANFVTVSIEWGGHGTEWTEPMIQSGIWLMRGIVIACGITEQSRAFEKHSWVDPGRKADPGRLFAEQVEPRLREELFGG